MVENFVSFGSSFTAGLVISALIAVLVWARNPIDRYAKKYKSYLENQPRSPLISSKLRHALRESFCSFLYFLSIMAVAVVLTFFEDFLRATHRPAAMLIVVQYATWVALLADMVIFAKLIWDAVILAGSKPHEPQGRE